MKTQVYKQLALASFMAGNVATAGAIGTWLASRASRRPELATDGLFLGVIGTAFYSLGNRLALASLDHAERVRFSGEDFDEPEAGIGVATTFHGEELPQSAAHIDAGDDVPPPQSRPLRRVGHSATM